LKHGKNGHFTKTVSKAKWPILVPLSRAPRHKENDSRALLGLFFSKTAKRKRYSQNDKIGKKWSFSKGYSRAKMANFI